MDGLLDIVRELTSADAQMPAVRPESSISRLHAKHHALARYIALDYSIEDAAIIAGYSPSGARSLLDDPTFNNLVEFYRGENADRALELGFKLKGLSNEAVEFLLEKFTDEEQRAKLTVNQAIEISKMTLDRTGHAPQTNSNVNVNINLADRLEAARKRVKVIEHE